MVKAHTAGYLFCSAVFRGKGSPSNWSYYGSVKEYQEGQEWKE